jgi:hypothetical protein
MDIYLVETANRRMVPPIDKGEGKMAEHPREFEVVAPLVTVDSGTGSATIRCTTDKGPIQLYFPADVFLFLQDQIAQRLAQARHGGVRMLPAVVGCHGLEASLGRSQLQIRLVLENESEGRLPIQESALLKLHRYLEKWFADVHDEDFD